jgi:rhamnose transport system permease protein
MWLRYKREISVAAAYVVLLLLLAAFAPNFYQLDNLRKIALSSAPMLVAAIGMTIVILTRNIDISIGAQLSLCAVAAGLLAKAGVPMPLVALAAVAFGALLGTVNGVLVAGLGLPSIVVTLATLVVWRESLRWWREGEFVKDLPADFQWFGLSQNGGLGVILAIALAIFVAFAWGLRYLAAGRATYAVGSDQEAARLMGIRPRRVVFAAFVIMGALMGIAALLGAVRFAHVDPNEGPGFELQVIAAVVVGGVAISGGRGTLVGTVLGVALLGTIGSALVFLGAEAHWEKAIQGAIILLAVASDAKTIGQRVPRPQPSPG